MGADSDAINRLTNEVFLGGDFSKFDDLVDDSYTDHDPMPGIADDKKGLRDTAQMVVATFDNRKMAMHELVETSDGRLVENWIMTGKHVGEAMGIPASNKDISVRGMELWKVANGKIVEHWGVVDIGDVLEKAGLVPPPS
ncbi:MAG TPA: ester cyclase [Acidimicrobiia bacterium]|nr:ester cyclase [Acidimicrobiia bacterium]